MSNTRFNEAAFQKHAQELVESGGNLTQISGQFVQTIEQVANAWQGAGANVWTQFAGRASEAQEQMKTSLTTFVSKVEGVATATTAGQVEQTDAVARHQATSGVDEVHF
ncbi:hypothetical protein [Gordonia sp. (in: high G+C Gram-positive bacteria)]|uniref:hypothetical protein n=1 Tax=Gordonia sp. (in: high G+C Gram-positive bacteria) TaxID=84139 RepID=UPI003C7267A2